MTGRAAIRLIDDPRAVTAAIVALVAAGLWIALWRGTGSMASPGSGAIQSMSVLPVGAPASHWSAGVVLSTAAMWLLMMAAMMLPSMAPMLAVYAGIAANEDRGAALALRVALFALGYFLLWALFSVAAALGQLALRDSGWLVIGGTAATPLAAGLLLLVAGAHQFSRIKDFCVRHCRHPFAYLIVHWREGRRGAFPLGVHHGVYCFGCCVAFMGLMFVFGTTNVLWMAVIALYFLAEKVLPHQRIWGRAVGSVLLVAGMATIAREVP